MHICARLSCALRVGGVVPAADGNDIGLPAARALSALDHVFIGGGFGAAEADAAPCVVGEHVLGTGDGHAIRVQRIAIGARSTGFSGLR